MYELGVAEQEINYNTDVEQSRNMCCHQAEETLPVWLHQMCYSMGNHRLSALLL